MAYDATIGIIMIGITFTLAYISSKFSENQNLMQMFFFLMTLGFITADLAMLTNVLIEADASSTLIDLSSAMGGVSIWCIIIFISLFLVQVLYNLIVKPMSSGYKTLDHFDETGKVLR